MKKIAVEEHVLTQGYLDYLRSRKEWPKRETVPEDGGKFEREWWAPDRYRKMPLGVPTRIEDLGQGRLKEMDEGGIDMQVLSLSFPGVEFFNAADAMAVSKIVNDRLAQAVKQYPQRFAAFATIAPQDPQGAAAELERAVKELGLKGVMVNGSVQGEYLDLKKYWPIFAKAEQLDVPIYIHPKMPAQDMIKPYMAYPGLTQAMLGFAADASLHAMRLILSGVFDKHPGLKIILGHLGEALPFWIWRMDSRWYEVKKFDHDAAEYYKDFKKTPSQYFKENFYVTTSGMFWAPALEFVARVFGADRILFATDYPYESVEEAVTFMDNAQLSQEDKENIYHSNAQRLLKL
ncbi:MAG TPA: amidohydrolase family protein [Dehalococcoidia bacterium]|nr:amidohydrolase family protein [Dehalococcoidia bacterium]